MNKKDKQKSLDIIHVEELSADRLQKLKEDYLSRNPNITEISDDKIKKIYINVIFFKDI